MQIKHIAKYICFLFIFLLLAGYYLDNHSSSAKTAPRTHIAGIDRLIQQAIGQNDIPGAVVQVKKGDTILHREAYGYAKKYSFDMQLLPNPEEMTLGYLFDLASLTKVCATTFGIMLLVDDDKVELDDPIYTWLSEFDTGAKRKITVRHLLTHTAGLYQWRPTYYHASTAEECYQYIAELPLKYEVGKARHYSDLGFMLLGYIIQKVSGQPLDKFLQSRLYQPLNLQHTVFNPLKKGFTKIAATSHGNPFEKHMVYDDSFGYTTDVKPGSWDGWRQYNLQGQVSDGNAWHTHNGVAGHAGLFSTVDDLQVLIDLLLNKGRFEGEQIITPSVIDTFLTKDRYGNALGWAMDFDFISAKGAPPATFGHTGFTGTSMVVIPKYELSILLLTNREQVGLQKDGYYYDLGPLRQKVVNIVLKKAIQ